MTKTGKIYIETYGCQLNVNDSEIILSLMQKEGYSVTHNIDESDMIVLNSCTIRDIADCRIYQRLEDLKALKKQNPALIICISGCLATKLSESFLEQNEIVDIIVSPDTYRSFPDLVKKAKNGIQSFEIQHSETEMYDDIRPLRCYEDRTTAAIVVMKGCNHCCTYCIEPFTRGHERSRDAKSIVDEAKSLMNESYGEVTLLGQCVDRYMWKEGNKTVNLSELLSMVAEACPALRIKAISSHPKYISEDFIKVIAQYPNITKIVHLPVQSGSNRILKMMNRGYTRELYLEKIAMIREILPDMAIATDIITGFCGETDEDFALSKSLVQKIGFDIINVFPFSLRSDTKAAELYADNVKAEIKTTRRNEILDVFKTGLQEKYQQLVGTTTTILIESTMWNKDLTKMHGRNKYNQTIVFAPQSDTKANQYVDVMITGNNTEVLFGEIYKNTNIK
jgi:tRNA-2-methylthio-N6-dimethylallyladenosine synthase